MREREKGEKRCKGKKGVEIKDGRCVDWEKTKEGKLLK